MKVIDLLNKIANGEKIRKIKYNGVIYENNNCNCFLNKEDKSLSYMVELPMFLNDKVEILEYYNDELYELNRVVDFDKINHNFKVLKGEIKQILEVLNNEYNK